MIDCHCPLPWSCSITNLIIFFLCKPFYNSSISTNFISFVIKVTRVMAERYQVWAKALQEHERLETFKNNWKFKTGKCSAVNMAKAGWYREECWTDDTVRCFVCFKELDGWSKDDDPWEEHQKHSSNCYFVKLKKEENELSVQEFIQLQKERIINQMVSRN